MRGNLRGAGAIICAFLFLAFLTPRAHAETPIDQCTDAGSAASAPAASGTGFQPEPNHATRPAASSELNFGTVNRRTGAFTYTVEDIALGAGEFPARLNLVRTYSSDRDGSNGGVVPNTPYAPGSIQWYAYGRGGTHNLDITFRVEQQSFSGQNYIVVAIRSGFQVETFQKCLGGQFRNTARNGSRLFDDMTYSAGGYRYETRDGAVLLFQRMTTSSGYTCERYRICGVLRRWTAPNGDWAEFEYEQYFSHPSNRAEPSFSGFQTVWLYNAMVQECHANFAGQSECHGVIFPNFYTVLEPQPAISSSAVYDQRLTRVYSSRGYELRFQYIDTTTDLGSICTGNGTGLNCLPGKNLTLARNRLSSVIGNWVSPGGQTTQLSQVNYSYSSCQGANPDCLSGVQTADGATTLLNWTPGSLAIQLPRETTPSTTITFTATPSYYFYEDRPRGYYTTNYRQTRSYWIVSSQSFADGSSVQYTPTVSNRWVAEPYGDWVWLPFVASMQVNEVGAVTTYNYVDAIDEHAGPVSVTDPLTRVTTNTYNAVGALASTTLPEGQVTQYAYDVRGNLLSTTRYPRPGASETPLTESSVYTGSPTLDANACTNQLVCNRPTQRTDARGAQTDFGWNSTTGLLVTATRPADPSGQRPTIAYTYGGFIGANSTTIQLLTSSTERIDATRNMVTTYGYGSNIRLPLREVSRTDGSTTLRTCLGTDMNGNQISVTQPNANLVSCP